MFKIEYNFEDELKLFVNRWGKDAQENMAIEEMAELTKELIKNKRGRENQKEIIEEIADVLITVLQMSNIYGFDEVIEVLNYKINRALNRVNSQLE